MKVVTELPTYWWGDARTEGEHEEVAVGHLIDAISRARGCRYQFLDRPDSIDRGARAADFRYRCPETGHIIAIEYKRFVDADEMEAAFHLKAGKRFRAKGAVRPLETDGEQYGSLSTGDPQDEVQALRDFIVQAVARRQLQRSQADERMLLVLDVRHIYLDFVTEASFTISEVDRQGVDHAFLLRPGAGGIDPAPSTMLEIW